MKKSSVASTGNLVILLTFRRLIFLFLQFFHSHLDFHEAVSFSKTPINVFNDLSLPYSVSDSWKHLLWGFFLGFFLQFDFYQKQRGIYIYIAFYFSICSSYLFIFYKLFVTVFFIGPFISSFPVFYLFFLFLMPLIFRSFFNSTFYFNVFILFALLL